LRRLRFRALLPPLAAGDFSLAFMPASLFGGPTPSSAGLRAFTANRSGTDQPCQTPEVGGRLPASPSWRLYEPERRRAYSPEGGQRSEVRRQRSDSAVSRSPKSPSLAFFASRVLPQPTLDVTQT
jgi:hypothetical protein